MSFIRHSVMWYCNGAQLIRIDLVMESLGLSKIINFDVFLNTSLDGVIVLSTYNLLFVIIPSHCMVGTDIDCDDVQ